MSDTPKRGWLSFSIRDLFLVTVIVALAVAWWVERRRANRHEIRAQEAVKQAESSLALSDALTQQLQNKNPAAKIEINVHGKGATTSTTYGMPNSSAPAPNQPKAQQ